MSPKMSGVGERSASRSNERNRTILAPSIVIDLTGDDDDGLERNEKRNEKVKKASWEQMSDLSRSSDNEPPTREEAKSPIKTQIYQDGGTYNLVTDSDSDGEPHIKTSDSSSKNIRSDRGTKTISRWPPSKSSVDALGTAGNPAGQGTARKTGSNSYRKSKSGSVGSVSSNLIQNKKISAPTSSRSTPAASSRHGNLSISGPARNSSYVTGQRSTSKSVAPSKLNVSQSNQSFTNSNTTSSAPQMIPASNRFAPLSTRDSHPIQRSPAISPAHKSETIATPRLRWLSSSEIKESQVSAIKVPQKDPNPWADCEESDSADDNDVLNPQQGKDNPVEFRLERQTSHTKTTDKQDKNLELQDLSRSARKSVVKRSSPDESAKGNSWSSIKDDDAVYVKMDREISAQTSLPGVNESSDHAESEVSNEESLSDDANDPEARRTPYQKKGNHGGARRGPAWEAQKLAKANAAKLETTDNETMTSATVVDDNENEDEEEDIQPPPQRKRRRNQKSSQRSVSGPSSARDTPPPSKSSEKMRHGGWKNRAIPVSMINESSKMSRQNSLTNEIQRCLARLEETMVEDRGLSVRNLLVKRQMRAHLAMDLDALDDESPFASLTSADKDTEGAVKLNVRTTSKNKTPVYVVPIIIGDGGVERTPAYTHHINVKRNHLTGDDEKLRYIPLVGTNNAIISEEKALSKLEKDLNTAYAEGVEDSREREQLSQIDRQIDLFLEDLAYESCNRAALVRYFLGHHSEKVSYSTAEKRAVLKSLGGPLFGELYETVEMIVEELAKAFNVGAEDVILSESRFKELVASSKAQAGGQSVPPERLETMAQFDCLICHGAACTTHGEYNYRKINKDFPSDGSSEPDSPERSSKKSDYEYVWERFIMHCPDVIRKDNSRDYAKKNENWHPEHWNTDKDYAEACGDECYRGRTEWTNYKWSKEEEKELKSMIAISKPLKPCSLVDYIDHPCWQIYSKILEFEDKRPIGRDPKLSKPPSKCEPAPWYSHKMLLKNRALGPGWQDETAAHMHDARPQPVPCIHDGPCRRAMNCSCVLNNILCEQFCGCPDECGRRFRGCSCHSEGLACASDSCICFQMNRECGDNCDSCGAIERLRPQNRYKDELFQDGCQNVALQRGVNKKLILGKSQLEGVGFGLFAAELIRKGEFLSEYAGEVISETEAERRGLIYDRKYLSFLFDLNKEWIIDAARLGNKTRFINHAESEADGLNCMAKVLLVNGEHRIAFRASRDIKIADELFFNYGKKFADIQGLNKKIGDGKGKMPKANKGVVTGEAALAELDGLGGRKGARRKKVRAIVDAIEEGGTMKRKKGRPRGKASKKAKIQDYATAPSKAYAGDSDEVMEDVDPMLYPDIVQDSDVEDETFQGKESSDIEMVGDGELEEEEEEEEEEDGARRTTRTRTFPKRYTR